MWNYNDQTYWAWQGSWCFILSAFERAYHIDPEDSFEAIHILEKLLEERLKIEKGYDDKKIEDFKKHAELEMNRLKPRASDSVWK